MRKNADALLEEFGNYIGIPNLVFDEENICVLSFGDEVVCLSVREDSGHIMVYADLGALENPAPPLALIALLEANCLQPSGITLGIRLDPDRNLYVVAQSLLLDLKSLDQERFQTMLESFITRQESWREKLPRLAQGKRDKTEAAGGALEHPPSSIRA